MKKRWLTFFRQYLIEVEGYQAQVKKYNEDLTDDLARKKARLAAKDAIQPSEEYLSPSPSIRQSTLTKKNTIYAVRYQFMLYRHWNLYDSMWHSRYIATRLGIWKDHGKKYSDIYICLS